jgi:hypothetical protein
VVATLSWVYHPTPIKKGRLGALLTAHPVGGGHSEMVKLSWQTPQYP